MSTNEYNTHDNSDYVDNIGNAVELYYNDTTTIKYYSLECCIKNAKSEPIDLAETRKIIKKALKTKYKKQGYHAC
ncbi:MAG: hypothetical protein PUI98_05255 [Finegoldia magna]|nr:hypothetical protein [Finegoldia magna]